MANQYTDTAALAGLVKVAYDRYVEFALRSQPQLRSIADKRPVQQAMPGSSVVFSLYNDLAAQTGELTETVDPEAIAVPDVSTVSVTLRERGATVLNTRKLGEFAFSDVDPAVANIVAYNLADSLDKIVATTLIAGTQVKYAGPSSTSTDTVGATDIIEGKNIREAVTALRAANVAPRQGMLYTAFIHPEVAHDLRAETGALSFEDISKYTNSSELLAGTTGTFGGAAFVETNRMPNATDGEASARVFRTLVVGQQALAEAVAVEPGVVIGPVTDRLMRFRPIGWYGLLGHAIYRDEAIVRIESSSSVNNA